MQGFTIADNVSNLAGRRGPNAQARLEYGREAGYTGPLPKGPVKPPLSVLSVSSVAKYSCYAAADKRTTKNSIRMEEEMQNKPNFMHFSPKNHDSTKKQTQFKPKQSHFYTQKPTHKPKQTQSKPNQTQFSPTSDEPQETSNEPQETSDVPNPSAELRNSERQKNNKNQKPGTHKPEQLFVTAFINAKV